MLNHVVTLSSEIATISQEKGPGSVVAQKVAMKHQASLKTSTRGPKVQVPMFKK